MLVNILAVGDIVGKSGLDFLKSHLGSIIKMKSVSFTVVNGENASNLGITPSQADEIFMAGADVITLGNHTYGKQEIFDYLDDRKAILRPANFAPQAPGKGWEIYDTGFGPVRVINLIGRAGGMDTNPDNPFLEVERILGKGEECITLVDMHAEMTSEKLAMGYFLDGRVSAVWGTHTHVQTSDCQIMPKGTGYITDLGMTGPAVSVLGIKPELSISRFLGNPRRRYEEAPGKCKMECAVFTIDSNTRLCRDVEELRIDD